MTDYESEIRGLLPLVVEYLKRNEGNFPYDQYHGHSRYKLFGNVLAAISAEPRTTEWWAWRAYDATNFRVLYSPELSEDVWDTEAVRILIYEQIQQHTLQVEIETTYGKFHVDDGMLILESEGTLKAWSIETLDFRTELTPAEIVNFHEYYIQLEKDHEASLIDWADNENERRIDEYFSRMEEKHNESTQ